MPHRYASEITYDEFVARVRRHRPSALLPEIARAAIELSNSGDFIERGKRIVLPWALAATAKESILSGNEHRRPGASQTDVRDICAAFNAVEDPLQPGSDDFVSQPESFFVRVSTEQFPFQTSHFEEIARLIAMYGDLSETRDLEVLDDGFLKTVLGASVVDYAAAGFVFGASAQRNGGYFDLEWLEQPNLGAITDVVAAQTLQTVFRRHFAIGWEGFKRQAGSHRIETGGLRRHEFNPLIARPFVEMLDGRYLTPQPDYIFKRITPAALYYQVLEALCRSEYHRSRCRRHRAKSVHTPMSVSTNSVSRGVRDLSS